MSAVKTERDYSAYLDGKTKRCLELLVCAVCICPAAVVMAFIAVMIFVMEGRPVLLMQPRVGRDGHVFRMPKFRTLNGGDAARPTRMGRFLRRHRLDELPQLFCVLSGRMSLVGPRPELPDIVAAYSDRHRCRLAVKPGVTGLWQVKGNRGKMIHEELAYDLLYLRKAGIRLDVKLVLLTILFMLKPETSQV